MRRIEARFHFEVRSSTFDSSKLFILSRRKTLPQHDINLFLDLPQHVFCPQHDYTSMTRLGNCLLKLQKKICGLETILSCQRVFGILEYISMFCSMTSVNLHPTSPHTPHIWSIIHHLPNSAIARPARAISALSSLGQPGPFLHSALWASPAAKLTAWAGLARRNVSLSAFSMSYS